MSAEIPTQAPSPAEKQATVDVGMIELPPTMQTNFEELEKMQKEIEADGVISVPEVIPRAIIRLRERADIVVKRLNDLKNESPTGLNEQEAARLLQEIEFINDRVAQEHKTWLTLTKYIQYKYEADAQVTLMKKEGFDVDHLSVDDKRPLVERQQEMNAHVQRILDLMKENAALHTVTMHEYLFRTHPTDRAQGALTTAVADYNRTLPKEGEPLTVNVVPGAMTTQLAQRRMETDDRLEASLNFSSPFLEHAYVLYQHYARTESGSAERESVRRQMLVLLAEKPATADEEKTQMTMRNILRNSRASKTEIAKAQTELPTARIEGVLLTADLLSSRMEQLMGSHAFDASSGKTIADRQTLRQECVDSGNATLNDLYQFQYLLIREGGGYENIRTTYAGTAPASETGKAHVPEAPGLAESNRQLAVQRATDLIQALEHIPEATAQDRMGATVYDKVMKTARRLLRNIKDLNDIMKTKDDMRSVPDVMKEDDIAVERLKESVGISKNILVRLPSLHGRLAASRQQMHMTQAEIASMTQPYENGSQRLSAKDIETFFASEVRPEDLIVLWLKVDAQTRHDLGMRSEAAGRLTGDLASLAQEGEVKTQEMREVQAKIRESLRTQALNLLKMVWDAIYNFLYEELGPKGMIGLAIVMMEILAWKVAGRSFIGATIKGGYNVTKFGLRQASRIGSMLSKPSGSASTTAGETAKTALNTGSRLARFLGHAGYFAFEIKAVAGLYKQFNIIHGSQEIDDEKERVNIALQLMESGETKQLMSLDERNTRDIYFRSMQALHLRDDALKAKIGIYRTIREPTDLNPQLLHIDAAEKDTIIRKLSQEREELMKRKDPLIERKDRMMASLDEMLQRNRDAFPIDSLLRKQKDGRYVVDLGGDFTEHTMTAGRLRKAMSKSLPNAGNNAAGTENLLGIQSGRILDEAHAISVEIDAYMQRLSEYEAAIQFFSQ